MSGGTKNQKDFTYPTTLHKGDEGHWVLFTSYPHGQQRGGTQQYTVALPMGAQSMITTAEAIYAEQDGLATILTEGAAAAATGVKHFDKSAQTPESATNKSIFDAVKGTIASVGEEIMRQVADKSDITKKLMAGSFSVATNPKLSLLYSGPGKFRKFVFEFPMIATSEKEAKTIENIIKVFRFSTVPGFEKRISDVFDQGGEPQSAEQISTGAGYNFYQFPSTWDIVFGHDNNEGGKTDGPFKIARSVCNSVLVNYAAAGVPFFFKDGRPFEVKLTLTFTETVIITKELVQRGY